MKSADFFDLEKFPAITFRSKRIDPKDGEAKITGDLTIHGVTREITLDVEWPAPETKNPWGKQRIGATATGKINRKDFGLTFNMPWKRAACSSGMKSRSPSMLRRFGRIRRRPAVRIGPLP